MLEFLQVGVRTGGGKLRCVTLSWVLQTSAAHMLVQLECGWAQQAKLRRLCHSSWVQSQVSVTPMHSQSTSACRMPPAHPNIVVCCAMSCVMCYVLCFAVQMFRVVFNTVFIWKIDTNLW